MQGSLRERRPGNWELIVQLPRDDSTGKRRQLRRTHLGTKREALRALAALGKVSSSGTTLGELLTRWLDHISEQLSPTTVREYRRLVRQVIGPGVAANSGKRWCKPPTRHVAPARSPCSGNDPSAHPVQDAWERAPFVELGGIRTMVDPEQAALVSVLIR